MNEVRYGIIGGGMGKLHMNYMEKLDRSRLTSFCDINEEVMKKTETEFGIKGFTDHQAMYDSGIIDAVIIATPHFSHPKIAIDAFKSGIHVLCEKPVAVHVKEARRMNEAHAKSNVLYGAMFQERTRPLFKKVKDILVSGELGELIRVNWIITSWFRTQCYYNSGDWRATWSGEGGGVLLNQCPHQLDLLQWITGMPKTVTGNAYLGKYHDIAVEDEVTACLEYENGATGIFITSTGELPGTNRLELTGDRGKLVLENDKLVFNRTTSSVKKFRETSKDKWGTPEVWDIELPVTGESGGHQSLTQNFTDSILDGIELIAPGVEGINSLGLGNAMLMAGLTGKPVDLPLDGNAYEEMLNELIEKEKASKAG